MCIGQCTFTIYSIPLILIDLGFIESTPLGMTKLRLSMEVRSSTVNAFIMNNVAQVSMTRVMDGVCYFDAASSA